MILSTLNLLNSCDIVMVLSQLLLVKQTVIPVTQLLVSARDRKKTALKTDYSFVKKLQILI